jgi:redox-sensitive bicupin YhaK (pirin superfamily)
VAWYGPIVVNTHEQLQQAFRELEQGILSETGVIALFSQANVP